MDSLTTGSLLLAVALLLLVGLFIFRPLLSHTGHRHGNVGRREALNIQKEALLATIQGLELEYETGKLPEPEFIQDRQRLMQEAANVLRELETLDSTGDDLDARIEAAIAQVRGVPVVAVVSMPLQPSAAPVAPTADGAAVPQFCPQCGAPARAGDKFCRQCGTPL